MRNDKKVFISVILISVLLIIGAVTLIGQQENSSESVLSSNVEAVVEQYNYDWGKIGINDGNVEKIFKIENNGSEVLKLSNVVTSCMCTTAQLASGGEMSPEFGMHSKSDYVMEVSPGGSAQLKVVFDPAFHGPSGVGPITRQITVNTNDQNNPNLTFNLSALVTK